MSCINENLEASIQIPYELSAVGGEGKGPSYISDGLR